METMYKKYTIVNALRQLVSTTLLVEFNVMQFTMDLDKTLQWEHMDKLHISEQTNKIK